MTQTVFNKYDYGDLVRASGAWTNSAGTAIDPTVVKFSYRDPSGNETVLTYLSDAALVRDSAGNYHVDIDADEAGVWYYRWWSTGTGQAAEAIKFVVHPEWGEGTEDISA